MTVAPEQTSPEDFRSGRPVNRRAYIAAVVAFVLAVAGGITAVVAYATDRDHELLGVGLAFALGGIGFGLVSWAKYLDLDEHAVQERHPLSMTPEDVAHLEEEVEMTRETLGRRKLLGGLLGASFVAMVAGFVGPVFSLGPSPAASAAARGGRPGPDW